MTDLEKVIAELRSVTEGPGMGQPWTTEDFESDLIGEAFAGIVGTILNAVVSGDMVPAAERDAAVAAALEDAADLRFIGGVGSAGFMPHVKKAILALINQPQADALARVRDEAVVDALTELKDAVQAIRMQAGGAADGVRFHVRQMIRKRISAAQADYEARIRAAIGGAPTPVGLFAALTDEQQRQALAFRGNPDFGPVETAEAKVARLVEAIERIKSRAMWVRGDQSYREFPKYILNAVRDALADIKGAKT